MEFLSFCGCNKKFDHEKLSVSSIRSSGHLEKFINRKKIRDYQPVLKKWFPAISFFVHLLFLSMTKLTNIKIHFFLWLFLSQILKSLLKFNNSSDLKIQLISLRERKCTVNIFHFSFLNVTEFWLSRSWVFHCYKLSASLIISMAVFFRIIAKDLTYS